MGISPRGTPIPGGDHLDLGHSKGSRFRTLDRSKGHPSPTGLFSDLSIHLSKAHRKSASRRCRTPPKSNHGVQSSPPHPKMPRKRASSPSPKDRFVFCHHDGQQKSANAPRASTPTALTPSSGQESLLFAAAQIRWPANPESPNANAIRKILPIRRGMPFSSLRAGAGVFLSLPFHP